MKKVFVKDLKSETGIRSNSTIISRSDSLGYKKRFATRGKTKKKLRWWTEEEAARIINFLEEKNLISARDLGLENNVARITIVNIANRLEITGQFLKGQKGAEQQFYTKDEADEIRKNIKTKSGKFEIPERKDPYWGTYHRVFTWSA